MKRNQTKIKENKTAMLNYVFSSVSHDTLISVEYYQ